MLSYQKNEILAELSKAQRFLLFCHVSPDGDTLGSALALAKRLQRLGNSVQIIAPSAIRDSLRFLPGCESVLILPQKPDAFDIAVAIDVSSKDMLRENQLYFDSIEKTILIDHHRTNPCFAQINMVDGDAPATAVLIYRLLCELPGELTQEESICLYTALVTDTGNFIYENTNAETFAIMEALMKAGLPIGHYGRLLFREKVEPFVRLLREALGTLSITEDGRIAGMSISLEQMRRTKADEGHRSSIVNYAIDIKGVCLAYLASEMPDGSTKISLRSQFPYDISSFAKKLGGGGHTQAAGLILKLPLDEAVQKIVSELKMFLQDVKL